eukprot:4103458-Prymnesium_polylepis.1
MVHVSRSAMPAIGGAASTARVTWRSGPRAPSRSSISRCPSLCQRRTGCSRSKWANTSQASTRAF